MNQSFSADVIVLGAGAAGLMCALVAGGRGRKVLLLEKGARVGRKILISWGGRCNFTNLKVSAKNYVSENEHFCKSALSRFTPADFIALIEKHGIAYHEKTLGQLFCDRTAKDITRMLVSECEAVGVTIITDCDVSEVRLQDGFVVSTSRGEFRSPAVVVATGGLAVAKLSSDIGYQIARKFGLRVTELSPALVPLTFSSQDQSRFSELSGIAIDAVVTHGGASFRENILVTHAGLSGPAILQISSYWKPEEPVRINLLPDKNIEELLLQKKREGDKMELKNFLAHYLPKRFAAVFCEVYGPSRPLDQCADAFLRKIARHLSAWDVIPAGTLGYEKAEVTLGGGWPPMNCPPRRWRPKRSPVSILSEKLWM